MKDEYTKRLTAVCKRLGIEPHFGADGSPSFVMLAHIGVALLPTQREFKLEDEARGRPKGTVGRPSDDDKLALRMADEMARIHPNVPYKKIVAMAVKYLETRGRFKSHTHERHAAKKRIFRLKTAEEEKRRRGLKRISRALMGLDSN